MLNDKEVFGLTIKTLRNNINLTQEKLSELCDLHSNFISELERGNKQPTLSTILILAKSLNVTPGNLMDIAFKPNKTSESIKFKITTLIYQQETKSLKKLYKLIKTYLEDD